METTESETAMADNRLSHRRGVALAHYELHERQQTQETIVRVNVAHHAGQATKGKSFGQLEVLETLVKVMC
jgi:hypothetical protein